MRRFDAESTMFQGLKDECEIIAERVGHGFVAMAARHPTLGKLVIVTAADGTGIVVETAE